MGGGEFSEMKDIPEIVLRSEKIPESLPIRPGLERPKIKQTVQEIFCTIERHI
jgi:hypothetical protein